MNVTVRVVSTGRGTWYERYEYQEVDVSLATQRDAAQDKARHEYHLLFRKPETTDWHPRIFPSAESRRQFLTTWFQDREEAVDIPPPSPQDVYFPLSTHGQTLISIVFIWDYMQLEGHEWRLNVYEFPRIVREGAELIRGQTGYSDALVALIDQSVVCYEEQNGEHIEVRFSDGTRLIFPWGDEVVEFV